MQCKRCFKKILESLKILEYQGPSRFKQTVKDITEILKIFILTLKIEKPRIQDFSYIKYLRIILFLLYTVMQPNIFL